MMLLEHCSQLVGHAAADRAGIALLGTVSSETLAGSIRVSAPNLRSDMTRSANSL